MRNIKSSRTIFIEYVFFIKLIYYIENKKREERRKGTKERYIVKKRRSDAEYTICYVRSIRI